MSQAAVEQVVGKLVLDRAFRTLMTSNMSQALAAYDLTEGERASFKGIDLDDFHQSVTGLDERVSKGLWTN
jgi:hypothetical protein